MTPTFSIRLAKEDFKFSVAHFTIFGPGTAEPFTATTTVSPSRWKASRWTARSAGRLRAAEARRARRLRRARRPPAASRCEPASGHRKVGWREGRQRGRHGRGPFRGARVPLSGRRSAPPAACQRDDGAPRPLGLGAHRQSRPRRRGADSHGRDRRDAGPALPLPRCARGPPPRRRLKVVPAARAKRG